MKEKSNKKKITSISILLIILLSISPTLFLMIFVDEIKSSHSNSIKTQGTLNFVDSLPSPPFPTEIAWDGQYLWVAENDQDKIHKLNPSTGALIHSFNAPGDEPSGLTWDGQYLWCADWNDDEIYKINPSTGLVVNSFDSPGYDPKGLTWDGQYLWVSIAPETKIYKLDASNGLIIDSFDDPSGNTAGLAWDGQSLWESDHYVDMIYKLSISTEISDNEKQQLILNMIKNHKNDGGNNWPIEVILAIICQEGGEGAFHTSGSYFAYNNYIYGPWTEPDNTWEYPERGFFSDGIMQVTPASGFNGISGYGYGYNGYDNDKMGYEAGIDDGIAYLDYNFENSIYGGGYINAILHYNTGPNSIYIYKNNMGDPNYLDHIATKLSTIIPMIFGYTNSMWVESLQEAQLILDEIIEDLPEGKTVSYYQPYQEVLDEELRNIKILEKNANIVLVIDRSGSMYGSKMEAAITSGKLFTDLMHSKDHLGVVSYSDYGRVEFMLSEIISSQIKDIAKASIDNIYASGMTAMGIGIQTAYDQFLNYGDPNHPWAIVLMSNGWHNTGTHPYTVIENYQNYHQKEVNIYTIGLGSGANGDLLREIARKGDGFYRFSPSESDLIDIYNDIAAEITGAQTLDTIKGQVEQGGTSSSIVYLDSTVTESTFSLSWGGSDLDLTLINPDGTLIDSNLAALDPNIEYIEENEYELYRILNPSSGTWTTNIHGIDVSGLSESFSLKITALTSLTLNLNTDKDNYLYPEPIKIMAELLEGAIPTIADVSKAKVIRPDKSEAIINLYDDGLNQHGDTVANDGIYSNFFTEFNEDGSYTIETTLIGTNSLNEAFTRQDFKSVIVSGVPTDTMPPATTLLIDSPQFIDSSGLTYITSSTPITLSAVDNHGVGSGVHLTKYRIYNSDYDYGWINVVPPISFQLLGLDDGDYNIDYYSIDKVGNTESISTQSVYLDNSAPQTTIETPSPNDGLQDVVTFSVDSSDISGVEFVRFSIKCAEGNIIGSEYENIPAHLNTEGKWVLYFETQSLYDGYYNLEVEAVDMLGNVCYDTVPFSIRNWAVLELLPETKNNKAGRTMPVKFSLRTDETVDPEQPFIYNEELTIKIYDAEESLENPVQVSIFGTTSKDYRIDTEEEHYITNFKTQKKKLTTYIVIVERKGMEIGRFEFETVK